MPNTPHNLPQTHCYFTAHDALGNAIFYDKPEEVNMKPLGPALFSVLFTTNKFPHEFDDDKDVVSFLNYKGIVPVSMPNGTVVRIVDLAPDEASPMHRTTSLDYGVVLEGEVLLVLEDLDNGPRRLMKRGDVSVQRATNHAWGKALPDHGIGDIDMPEQ
ncbi:hypothetical protein N7474_005012 [Penicillium riverlandense]|uniref:uncharacterized protein n=1 Tax=Penicillium riverlandense TaxID=1903569 RepID=UPI002547AEAB|nr:uncharacterized protein N7474_005012 [Penicillium riverlandense]KAJ5819421.1 hypothetical protein N7474_005012 [Penicillium riverlandense]